MDRNCVSSGVCFFPDARWRCDISCSSLSRDGCYLATGTRQGSVVLWKVRRQRQTPARHPVSLHRFKELYERSSDVAFEPYFMLVASNNPIAFPVKQVAFASGFRSSHSLKCGWDDTVGSYSGVENAEEVLVALHKDNSVAVWSLTDCRCLHKVKGPPFAIKRMCVLPDDRFIALVGRCKINVIDLWRLKLIGMLELNGSCHFDKTTYTSGRSKLFRGASGSDPATDANSSNVSNASASSSPDCTKPAKPRYILRANCGPVPFELPYKAENTTASTRNKTAPCEATYTEERHACPLLISALLDNNELVTWDLTAPIMSYKAKHGASNGPIVVVTRWDRHNDASFPSQKRSHRGRDRFYHFLSRQSFLRHGHHGKHRSPDGVDAGSNFAVLREWLPELEGQPAELRTIDRHIFVMVGVRIIVWHYGYDGSLARVAELLSLAADGTMSTEPWHGFQCVRVLRELTLLVAWVANGRVSVFAVPDAPDQPLALVATHRFPRFDPLLRRGEHVHVHVRGGSPHHEHLDYTQSGCSSLRFRLIRHTPGGRLSVGMPHHKFWMCVCTDSLLSDCFSPARAGVIASCLFHDSESTHRLELQRDGTLRRIDISTGDTRELPSCRSIQDCLRSAARSHRMKSLVLPGSTVMEWLQPPSPELSTPPAHVDRALMHCVGSNYLVVCVGASDILVYSLASLDLALVLRHFHHTSVRAIYDTFTVSYRGPKVTDAVLHGNDDTFVSVGSDGGLVLVQLSPLLDDLAEDCALHPIRESAIYSDMESDGDDSRSAPPWSALDHFTSTSSTRRGIHRMQRSEALLHSEIERVVLNSKKNTLFVLTHSSILLWRLSDGRFLRALPYLETYRQAVWVASDSSSGSDHKLRNASTLANTLTSFLTTEWPSTTFGTVANDSYQRYLEQCTPHDLLSLSIFQERHFKRRISTSLHTSFLRMNFAPSPSSDPDVTEKAANPLPGKASCGPSPRGLTRLRHITQGSQHVCRAWHVLRGSRSRPCVLPTGRLICSHLRCHLALDKTLLARPTTVSHAVPVLIFPLQEVLSNLKGNGGSLLAKVVGRGTVCYLGIPSGTFSIPLRYSVAPLERLDRLSSHDTVVSTYFLNDYIRKEKQWPGIRRSFTFPCMFDQRKVMYQLYSTEDVHPNGYFSTCMLLWDAVVAFHSGASSCSHWARSADVWLLAHLMVVCACRDGFSAISKALINTLCGLSRDQLYLHVCRALAVFCCSTSRRGPSVAFPGIRVCHCHATTFSFGKHCGFCLQPSHDLGDGEFARLEMPLPWEEDASLLLLVTVVTEKSLSSMCNFVCVSNKQYSFAAYVAQLMLPHMLASDEDKPPHRDDSPPGRRAFDPRAYCLEMFAGCFPSAWTLKDLDDHGISSSSLCKNRIHSLTRSFYQSAEGNRSPAAQFILSALALYRSTKSAHWLSILRGCFSQDPPLVIRIMRWVVRERRVDKWYIETSVKLILDFVTEFRDRAVAHLPDMVVIIVRCLDPSDSHVRMLMLKPATSALFHLVKNFPMVAFYQDTQRFAVGSSSGHVLIYDLRTATKCRVLGGDVKSVASLAFSSTGDYIAAYYMDPPCLVLWNCSSSGLLGGLIHSGKNGHKVIKLKPVEANPSASAMDVKLQSKSNREWFLHREDGRGYMISI